MGTIDTIHHAEQERLARTSSVPAIRAPLRRMLRAFSLWLEKRETRRTLRDLTDVELKDVGLTRHDAKIEVAKSFFWD
ncbi:MAG: DUF1127 domain-containing protein [Rhizobiaceae bacterium]|nr:DUF1127 domain-containing protein [Rhizobiaceae bacterium]